MAETEVAYYENTRDKDKLPFFGISTCKNFKNHFHRNFEILYVTKGELNAEVNGKPYTVKEGQALFVTNYYTHSYDNGSFCEKAVIMIPYSYCTDVVNVLKNKTLPIVLDDIGFNKQVFEVAKNFQRQDLSGTVKKGYVTVLMGMLIDHYPLMETESNKDVEFIVEILDYIDNNYQKDLTLDSVATNFGYNKYYFSKIFNKYISENFSNYVSMIRLQNFTKKISNDPSLSITSVAFDCGFNSLATFYRYFVKVYGISPTDYIQQITQTEREGKN